MKIRNILIIVLILIAGIYLFFKTPKTTHTPQALQNQTTTVLSNSTAKQNTQSIKYISAGASPNIPLNLPGDFTIHIFATGLGTARDLQFSPGGTLIVSNPSGNSVYALPDKNNDGVADEIKPIISGENHVHGLAFYNGKLFIADVDKVVRYNWNETTLTATKDKVLFTLPENEDHNNRSLIFTSDGKLFISLGSTCNICRQSPTVGGSVLASDANGTPPKVFATGLRNSPFFAINPKTKDIWATEMGRDYLGDNTPPDEINILYESKNYGWPNCYGNKIHDTNFDGINPDNCGNTEPPIYQIPAHSAPLGLTFINSSQFPEDWQGDLLVAYHGSWNRSVATGYKVVHLKVNGNTITGSDDFLTGFLQGTTQNSSLGRPVDLTFDKYGNLYLSDDKSGNVYIIQKK